MIFAPMLPLHCTFAYTVSQQIWVGGRSSATQVGSRLSEGIPSVAWAITGQAPLYHTAMMTISGVQAIYFTSGGSANVDLKDRTPAG